MAFGMHWAVTKGIFAVALPVQSWAAVFWLAICMGLGAVGGCMHVCAVQRGPPQARPGQVCRSAILFEKTAQFQ